MGSVNLSELDTWDRESGALNVIIETAKCSRNKLRYNPDLELFELAKVLPRGLIFPFDFGFVPSTLGEDGDPLDILVLMGEPVPAGCKIESRLIGVIEAEQTENGKTERNDRLIAVAVHCRDHEDIHSIKELGEYLVKEIENFFISYNAIAGKKFKPVGCHGPGTAEKLIKEGAKRYRKEQNGRQEVSQRNGKPKAGKS